MVHKLTTCFRKLKYYQQKLIECYFENIDASLAFLDFIVGNHTLKKFLNSKKYNDFQSVKNLNILRNDFKRPECAQE